jgi:hypothetical protein
LASAHTPADDIVYNLVSIQYHALKGGEAYARYEQDAHGHQDVVAFIGQCRAEDAQRAIRCHDLLGKLTAADGIG